MAPKQIADNLRLKFGVDLNEKTARREEAARRAKATLLKDTTSQREEYHRLPAYINELGKANPSAHLKLNLKLFSCTLWSISTIYHQRGNRLKIGPVQLLGRARS